MDESPQAAKRHRRATLAFRVTSDAKHLVKAAAARRDALPSDYLRSVLWSALEQEFGALAGDRPTRPDQPKDPEDGD